MGDHSSPPFAPGSMNTPSAVGWLYMFCCGTNAAERRISLPVAASSTYTKPVFPASTTAFLPPTIAITGGLTASRSHTSCGTSWYPHLNLPLVASIATTDSVQRLSPGRIEPSRSGDGFPIATNSVFVASSYAGVIHTEPPPVFQASAYLAESARSFAMSRLRSSPSGVVLENGPHQPPSSGEGSVYHVHTGAPLAAFKAFTQPRMPYSAPEVPMITLSPITSGAMVSVYPAAGPSPTFTSHFTLPVVASSATRLSSSVPRNTDPPETATPRLLGPQQAIATGSFLCVHSHNIFCVGKLNARTSLLGVAREVMYMTPATTIAVVS